MFYENLLQNLKDYAPSRVSVAVVSSVDLVKGLRLARDMDIAIPVLCGQRSVIEEKAEQAGVELYGLEIVDTPDDSSALIEAVSMLASGRARAILKGNISSSKFLHEVLNRKYELRPEGGLLSHLAVFYVPALKRPFFLTDGGMLLYPDLRQKVEILKNAIPFVVQLGIPEPKVAILSASEVVDPRVPSAVHAIKLKEMAKDGIFDPAIVDGPFALDLAVSIEAATIKGIVSPVAGKADILLCPDIVAGNLLGKSMMYLANAESSGVVLGARKPIVMLSRADKPETTVRSISLALSGGKK